MAPWAIEFHDEFEPEFDAWTEAVREELLAHALLLAEFGPQLSRPHADTLNGSTYSNMKELRFRAADGVWRVAYAFDPDRKAILLVGGSKSGVSEKRFYKSLIERADARYAMHLKGRRARSKER
ncbi:type II toxin-antitoxin system RelE/ParE family toxin [Roseomonas sp. HF4]|uniref:type II toxin-antitoxin system RelE/ParE family toxin n=1 Tax=Roseomonas sp. HF4 TaxID=2562313 RepID=UPI0010C010B0|nr:type II toxin-antitoxin system RelE/ParE family toxin [Roseomonas sp. HF4]